MVIQEQIGSLIKLQEIDTEIYKFNEQKAATPAEKQALEQDFQQKKEGLKVKENDAKSLQLKRKEREMDLETKDKEIKKYQAQLMQIKTNKEYMALQKEIEGLKADNSCLEDDILGLMDKIDKAKLGFAAEKEKVASQEKQMKEELARIDQEIKQIEEESSVLEKQRAEICVNIDKGLLSRYERILKAKTGLALVPLVGESCGGCNRVLPPQVINETRTQEEIVTCEFCARLLYWPQ